MTNSHPPKPAPTLSALESNLLGVKVGQAPSLLAGLLATALLAILSTWLSKAAGTALGFAKSPLSAVTTAILLGLLIGNLIPLPKWLKPGLNFAVKKVLRAGIILLGLRLSLFDVFKLGVLGVPVVLLCIIGALVVTDRLSRWFHLPERLGTLIAVGTSICGVSAIVATGCTIDAKDEEVAYAVAVITIFGIVATLVYPYAAHALFAQNATMAGLFLGTSIHDTSQVTGAALIYRDLFALPRALDVATVTKLVRNVFIAFVIPLMAFAYARKQTCEPGAAPRSMNILNLLPLFVLGFLVAAFLRSVGDAGLAAGGHAFGLWSAAAWKGFTTVVEEWAVNLLVVALAGVGLSTSFRSLKGLGLKPFVVGLGAALAVGGISALAISLLGTFVTY